MPIVNRSATVEEIRTMLREPPLGALLQMLPEAAILNATDEGLRRAALSPAALSPAALSPAAVSPCGGGGGRLCCSDRINSNP